MEQQIGPLRAVIFDMDGTMVDTESLYHAAWQNTAQALGYTIGQDVLRETIGRRMEDCLALIQQALGSNFPMARFEAEWWEVWERMAEQHGIARKHGLDALLDLLDAQQIPKAVATSSAQAEARYTLERAGLAERFSIVVTGDQITRGKPAPDIFLLAAERLGIHAAHCMAIEDSEAGVYAATAAGMCTFMVPDLIPPQPETAQRAFQVVNSLADVQEWILRCGWFEQI